MFHVADLLCNRFDLHQIALHLLQLGRNLLEIGHFGSFLAIFGGIWAIFSLFRLFLGVLGLILVKFLKKPCRAFPLKIRHFSEISCFLNILVDYFRASEAMIHAYHPKNKTFIHRFEFLLRGQSTEGAARLLMMEHNLMVMKKLAAAA